MLVTVRDAGRLGNHPPWTSPALPNGAEPSPSQSCGSGQSPASPGQAELLRQECVLLYVCSWASDSLPRESLSQKTALANLRYSLPCKMRLDCLSSGGEKNNSATTRKGLYSLPSVGPGQAAPGGPNPSQLSPKLADTCKDAPSQLGSAAAGPN